MANYEQIAKESRLKVLDLVHKAGTSHIGSLMGCADIFAVLGEKIDWDKDEFVLSAGWKAALLYYHLWRKGRITLEELDSYCMEGSKFIGLAEPIIPEIKIAGGSMGLGLPGAVGLALAKKVKEEEGTVYCLMSDGEVAIGTTWESLLIARQHKLDNLVVIVEENGLQAMGRTEDVLRVNMPMKYNAVDGHDFYRLEKELPISWWEGSEPPFITVAQTTKGKGVSFMEDNNLYHYAKVTDEDYEKAKKELHG